MRVLLANVLLFLCAHGALAGVLFSDDFEGAALAPSWSAATTVNGRVAISENFEPSSGTGHLVLDDSVNDANYSVAEAILTVDLAHRKNVVLQFRAKSLGNEPHLAPQTAYVNVRTYDGVAVSVDGGVSWIYMQSLAEVSTAWQAYSIGLDQVIAYTGVAYPRDFKIRFSQYDNSPAPVDGIAIDEVRVLGEDDQRSVVEMASPLIEGTGPQAGYVVLSFAPAEPLTLTLTVSQPGQLIVPPTVTVPAGARSVGFEFSAAENSSVDLTRTVSVTATADGVIPTAARVTIYDDEAPVPTLTVPAQLFEGQLPVNNASVSIDRPATAPLTLHLGANPAVGEVTMPASVTIPAGQTQVAFTIQATDDYRIDGTIAVTITATAAGITSASAQTATLDNETRALTLELPPSIQEGSSTSGTVRISGTLQNPLTVTLTSGDGARLRSPATVTIPAGSTSTGFTLDAVDNTDAEGSRDATLAASAAGFSGSSKSIIVRDNEVTQYRFAAVPDIVDVTAPVAVTVIASAVDGATISGVTASVRLEVVLPDGGTAQLQPATVTLQGSNGWSGFVSLPAVSMPGLRLRATDGEGRTGNSAGFDALRVLGLPTADLAWDASRRRLYASVPASAASPYANQVVAIDPETMQVAASVTTGQNPRHLMLTTGAELLYVALDGNGTVATIDPASFTVVGTFVVGTDNFYGTLFAADLAPVAGAPNSVVVSQYTKSSSPGHRGVAVYDNGVMRPTRTQGHTGSNIVEPSSDPSIFFGYNLESTEYGFRKLQIDGSGVKELSVNRTLFASFGMRSEGDRVFSYSGAVVDGINMRRVGTFGAFGTVCPDLALGRAYMLEQSGNYEPSSTISAFDAALYTRVAQLSLPRKLAVSGNLLRWGADGLAFRSGASVALINSRRLVPVPQPADLRVTALVTPPTPADKAPIVYTIDVTNHGPHVARDVVVTPGLSSGQTIVSFNVLDGDMKPVGSSPIPELAPGASIRFTITATALDRGGVSCTGRATSSSYDPDFGNNSAVAYAAVGFSRAVDALHRTGLQASSLVSDEARQLLWAAIPSAFEAPFGRSVVSIDPITGLIVDVIRLDAEPMPRSIALSKNGRYLYVGLKDVPDVHRIDLSTKPYASVRIPLGLNGWNEASYATDIEPLDGDGTSFMITTLGDESASVYDGTVRRAQRTGIYTIKQIERTATPNVFFGFPASTLNVTASGVSITKSVPSLMPNSSDVRGAGNLAVSEHGYLVDSSTLTLKANLGVLGGPCLDLGNGRAHFVTNEGVLRSFDLATGLPAGNFSLPLAVGSWLHSVVRWGADGLAFLNNDGRLYFMRSSVVIPAGVDQNRDRIADAWAAKYFGDLQVSLSGDSDGDGVPHALEYLFGTSPVASSSAPSLQPTFDGSTAPPTVHLLFLRRAGVVLPTYTYEVSRDLASWGAAPDVAETVVSTTTGADGPLEWVSAAIPAPGVAGGFVRLKWLGQ